MGNIENNLCNLVQQAIFSDEILSEEYKNHINQCPCCKKLLSQKEIMICDLSKFALQKNPNDDFVKKVMTQIENSKQKNNNGVYFKLTRYASVAAAVVVVCVSALVMYDKSHYVQNDVSPVTLKYMPLQEETISDDATEYAYEDRKSAYDEFSVDIESDQQVQQSRIMLKMAKSDEQPDEQTLVQEDVYVLESQSEYDMNDNYTYVSDETLNQDNAFLLTAKESDEQDVQIETESFELMQDMVAQNTAACGGGGGSAGAVSKECYEESVTDEADDEEACENEQDVLIFADVAFARGEKNFEYNLQLLQIKLDELYNGKYSVDKDAFVIAGYDNDFVMDVLYCMTESEFLQFVKSQSLFVCEE